MQERGWWYKDPDWYHKWEQARALITDKPSPFAINEFLRNVPVFEQRFLSGVKADLPHWKAKFEDMRSFMESKGKDYSLAEFCKLVLDYRIAGFNLQEFSPDATSKASRVRWLLLYEFYSEMMFLLAPLGQFRYDGEQIKDADDEQLRLLKRSSELFGQEIPHTQPASEQIKIYQELMKKDPTGFELIDYQSNYMRELEEPNASDSSYPIWTAGREFGQRVYKELFTLLNTPSSSARN